MRRSMFVGVFSIFAPLVASAQSRSPLDIPQVVRLFDLVINPIIQLLFAAAVFYFAYGVFTYIRKSDDSGERLAGGRHILWSTIGLFIMISVWGIIAIIRNTLGIS